jgi:hypothetical protein
MKYTYLVVMLIAIIAVLFISCGNKSTSGDNNSTNSIPKNITTKAIK